MIILILCIIFSSTLNLDTPLPGVLNWFYNHPLLAFFIIIEFITDTRLIIGGRKDVQ